MADASSVAQATGTDPEDLLNDLSGKVEDLSRDIESCIVLSDSTAGLTGSAGSLLEVSDTFMGSTRDVLTANDKLLEEAEKQLGKDMEIDTKVIKEAKKSVESMTPVLSDLRNVMIDLASDNKLAFDLFIDLSRDKWVSKIDNMKKDADEQSKIVAAEGFTALAERFDELSATLADISAELKALNKSMGEKERETALKK